MSVPSSGGQSIAVHKCQNQPNDFVPVLLLGAIEVDDEQVVDLLRQKHDYDKGTNSIIIENKDTSIKEAEANQKLKKELSFKTDENFKRRLYISINVHEIDLDSYASDQGIENKLSFFEYQTIILSYDYYNSEHIQRAFEKLKTYVSKNFLKISIIVMELRSTKSLIDIAKERNQIACNSDSVDYLQNEVINLDEVKAYEEKCSNESRKVIKIVTNSKITHTTFNSTFYRHSGDYMLNLIHNYWAEMRDEISNLSSFIENENKKRANYEKKIEEKVFTKYREKLEREKKKANEEEASNSSDDEDEEDDSSTDDNITVSSESSESENDSTNIDPKTRQLRLLELQEELENDTSLRTKNKNKTKANFSSMLLNQSIANDFDGLNLFKFTDCLKKDIYDEEGDEDQDYIENNDNSFSASAKLFSKSPKGVKSRKVHRLPMFSPFKTKIDTLVSELQMLAIPSSKEIVEGVCRNSFEIENLDSILEIEKSHSNSRQKKSKDQKHKAESHSDKRHHMMFELSAKYAQEYRGYRQFLDVIPHPVDSLIRRYKVATKNNFETQSNSVFSYSSDNEIPPPPPLPITIKKNDTKRNSDGILKSSKAINTNTRNLKQASRYEEKSKENDYVDFFNDKMRSLEQKLKKTRENKNKSISNDKGISLFTLDIDLGGGRGGFLECFHDGNDKAAVTEFFEKQAIKASEQDIKKLMKIIKEKRRTYKTARSNLLWVRPNIGELKLTLDDGRVKTIPIREMDAPHYLIRQFLSENPGSLTADQIVKVEELMASFIRSKQQKQKDNNILVNEKTGYIYDESNDFGHAESYSFPTVERFTNKIRFLDGNTTFSKVQGKQVIIRRRELPKTFQSHLKGPCQEIIGGDSPASSSTSSISTIRKKITQPNHLHGSALLHDAGTIKPIKGA